MLKHKGLAMLAACAALAIVTPLRADQAASNSTPAQTPAQTAVFADDQTTTRTPLMQLLHDAGVGDTLEKYGIDITGFVEGSYNYNFEKPIQNPGGPALPHLTVGRSFDQKYDAAVLNQTDLMIQRAISADPSKWNVGFAMEWIYGHDSQYIHSNGLQLYGPGDIAAGHPDNQFDLNQLYVTVNAPIGNGILFEFGQFIAPEGYETINPISNPFFSHSYLFNYAIPATLTGLTGTYSFNPNWTATAGVIRGWNQSLKDTNGDNMSYTAGFTYNSTEKQSNGSSKWSVPVNVIFGPEQPKNDSNWRYLIDVVANYQLSDNLKLGFNGDFDWERNASGLPDPGHDANWWGAALYAGYTIDPRFTVNGRVEYFSDHYDAQAVGLGSEFYEATAGVTITPFPDNQWLKGLEFRPEVRYDYSTKGGVFLGTEKNWQITTGADLIYAF
jgi:putative OmpL-like beta-barrel porin-2